MDWTKINDVVEVERSFAWAGRFRRLTRDYERRADTLAGLHFLAFAILTFKTLFNSSRQVHNMLSDKHYQPMNIHTHENTASVVITSSFFYLMAAIVAEFTVLTHLSQILNISFKLYFEIALGVCIVTVAFWLLSFKRWTAKINKHDTKALLLLLGLGLVGAIISLIVNRPDDDDFYYVPNVIFYIQNPKAFMGFKIHYLFSSHHPFESFTWATSNAYEYMQALVAFGFRLSLLDVYYFIMPAIAGFLIPIALYLALVHFADDTLAAVIGTIVTIGIILSLIEVVWRYHSLDCH